MKVAAPNPKYTGLVGRDQFVQGVCSAASEAQRGYYLRHGYTIEESGTGPQAGAAGSETGDHTDRSGWKKSDWLIHAKNIGIELAEKVTVPEVKAAVAEVEAAAKAADAQSAADENNADGDDSAKDGAREATSDDD